MQSFTFQGLLFLKHFVYYTPPLLEQKINRKSQSMNFYSPWKPTISWWFWGGNRSWLIHLNSLNIGRETWQQSLKEPYLWKLEWGKFCSNLHYSKQSRSLFTMKTNHDLYHIIILRARSCASLKFFPCNHQTFEYVIIRARDLSE